MARDSSSGFQQGYHSFLYGHKKYNWGSGRKRTNEQYWLRSALSARRVVLWHFFVQLFMHLVDYRWECIFRETPTEATRNANSSLTILLTASFCWLLSTLDCLSVSIFANYPSGFSRNPPVPLEISSPSPLFHFAPKQTKEIVCLADHPHSVRPSHIAAIYHLGLTCYNMIINCCFMRRYLE